MQCTEAGVVIALRRRVERMAHSSREVGELPEIGIDYGFFGRDKEDVSPILCVKCRNSSTGCGRVHITVELDRTCDEQFDGWSSW